MRDPVINRKLHHLGVDHDQLHILRRGSVDQAHDHGVDAHGLTGAGLAGDQKMGHFCQIRHHRLAADVLSHGKGQAGGVLPDLRALQKLPQIHNAVDLIGDLDAHSRLSGDGSLDPDVGGRQVELDIVGQGLDLADLHSLLRMELIPGHSGPAADIGDGDAHAEIPKRLL